MKATGRPLQCIHMSDVNVCNANDNDYEDEMERELECCGLYRPTRDSDWVDAMPMPERIISLVRFLLLLFIE